MPKKQQLGTPEEARRLHEQSEEIYEQQKELLRNSDHELELADLLINSITGLDLTSSSNHRMRQLIRTYGFREVLDAIRESLTAYTWDEEEGGKFGKLANALKDLDKLLKIRKLKSSDPEEAKCRYLGGILKKRFNGDISWSSFGALLSRWRAASKPVEDLYEIAKTARSWWEFKRRVEELLVQLK